MKCNYFIPSIFYSFDIKSGMNSVFSMRTIGTALVDRMIGLLCILRTISAHYFGNQCGPNNHIISKQNKISMSCDDGCIC